MSRFFLDANESGLKVGMSKGVRFFRSLILISYPVNAGVEGTLVRIVELKGT